MPFIELGARFVEFRDAELGAAPEPAQGGRLLEPERAAAVEFEGRFALPKPCGARPESVELPCALQAREEVFERADEFTEADGLEPCCKAEGGRLEESCDWRLAPIPDGVPADRPVPAAGELPGLRVELFMVRTGKWDADAAGAVRAITLRFCTLAEGVATRPWELEAPR